MVLTTRRILDGQHPITRIVRDDDGVWHFLENADVRDGPLQISHLHHLYAAHPHIKQHAGLAAGRQVQRTGNGTWIESATPTEIV